MAAAGGTLALTSCANVDTYFAADKKSFDKEVFVIGGGAAGLMAAHTLKKARIPFRLFEASSRPGGRVYTLENADGTHVDMGAEFFESHHRLVFELLKEFQLEWEERAFNPVTAPLWRSTNGQSLTDSEYQKISSHFIKEYIQTRVQVFGNNGPATTAAVNGAAYQVLSPVLAQEMDSYSLTQYLNSHWVQPDERVANYWDAWSRSHYSVEANRVSALRWLWDQQTDKKTRNFYKVKEGWGQLIQLMFERVAGVIPDHLLRLNWQLVDFRRKEKTFQCVFKTKKGTQVLEAENVILALPIGQYQRINGIRDLELSETKKNALSQIQMGESSKVYMAFTASEVDLKMSTRELFRLPQLLRDQVQISTTSNSESKIWIGGLRGGDQSQWTLPDIENWRAGLLNTNSNSPLEYQALNWKDRPFIQGARSIWGPGQWGAFNTAFETPDFDGHLHWAGEHVPADEKGTVHAALLSGQQAALKLIAMLGPVAASAAPTSI
jgi:monoamine oxidase